MSGDDRKCAGEGERADQSGAAIWKDVYLLTLQAALQYHLQLADTRKLSTSAAANALGDLCREMANRALADF